MAKKLSEIDPALIELARALGRWMAREEHARMTGPLKKKPLHALQPEVKSNGIRKKKRKRSCKRSTMGLPPKESLDR